VERRATCINRLDVEAELISGRNLAVAPDSSMRVCRFAPTGRDRAMKHLRRDIRYALRSWKRQPGFVAITILVLGCGIGMAVTVFSLFDAVLLHSLPFRHSERVVLLWQQDLSSGRDRITLSSREYSAYSMQSHAFESLGAVRGITLTTGTGEASAFVDGVQVTRSLFDTMGVSPVLGRAFAFDEDTPGNDHVALLTYEFWQRGFGGDSNVVGRKLKLRAGFESTSDKEKRMSAREARDVNLHRAAAPL